MTRSSPTSSRTLLNRLLGEVAELPSAREQPQMANRKLPRTVWPSGVCVTSGWNCRPKPAARGV